MLNDKKAERKSVKDYVLNDMWGHNLMSGDAIRGCVTGETSKTIEEKLEYCQGIFTVFPHMMLMNFSNWLWENNMPKAYDVFMKTSIQTLQDKVFPELDRYYKGGLSDEEKAKIMVRLLTEVVPQHILTGYYNYMFADQEDYKDIADFWAAEQPLMGMIAHLIRSACCDMNQKEKSEAFLFLGGRYPFLILKRLYDWQFGKDKLDFPPPPPAE